MQLSVMRDTLRRRIGNPSTVDTPNSDLTSNINSAYEEIANRFRFRAMRKSTTVPTVNGTLAYGLPADAVAIINIRDATNEKRLIKLDDKRRAALVDVATTGKPTAYFLLQTTYELYPKPDGVYSIILFYKASYTGLSADGDIPVLPLSWHEGILRLAKHYYYSDQSDNPKATLAFNEFDLWAMRQPLEVDEEKGDFDSGVSIPTLSENLTERLDFDHSP